MDALPLDRPVTDLIRARYSCRIFRPEPLAPGQRRALEAFLGTLACGPLGAPARFILAADAGVDGAERRGAELRGLGTYGFIQNAAAYFIGAVGPGGHNLEDYGYLLECAVLYAAGLGVGTCWLGGSFTRSSFAHRIQLRPGESLPAVAALGLPAEGSRTRDLLRRSARADRRLLWKALFFDGSFDRPLDRPAAGAYALPLEMLRQGPSASNKQPWRLLRRGDDFHFYLARTPGYGRGSLVFNLLGLADLQRLDLGIAMAHFELTARSLGLPGGWRLDDPRLPSPSFPAEYVVTWRAA